MFQGIYKSAINDANKNYIFGTGSIPIQIKVANLETFAKAENKQQGYQVAEVNKLISTMLTGWSADGNKPKSMSDNYLELILSCDNGFVVKKRLQFPHIIAWQNDNTPYNIADIYKQFSIDNWLKADDFENPDITLVVEPTDEILTTSTATPPEVTTTNSGRFYLYYRNLPIGVNRIHIDFHIKTQTEPIDFDLEVIDGLSWKDAQVILASNEQAKINVLLYSVKDVYNFTGAEGDFEDITMHEWSALYQQIISLKPNNKFTHDLYFYVYDESEINTKNTELELELAVNGNFSKSYDVKAGVTIEALSASSPYAIPLILGEGESFTIQRNRSVVSNLGIYAIKANGSSQLIANLYNNNVRTLSAPFDLVALGVYISGSNISADGTYTLAVTKTPLWETQKDVTDLSKKVRLGESANYKVSAIPSDLFDESEFIIGDNWHGNIDTSVKYRVVMSSIQIADRDLYLSILDGYRFALDFFVDGVYSSSVNYQQSPHKIPQGTEYVLKIERYPEDTSLEADLGLFVSQVRIQSEFQQTLFGEGLVGYYGQRVSPLKMQKNYQCDENVLISQTMPSDSNNVNKNAAGLVVYGNRIFSLNDGATCSVFALDTLELLQVAPLPWSAHNNNAQPTPYFYNSADTYPLLLVSRGDYAGQGEQKFYFVRVVESSGSFTFTIVKEISYSGFLGAEYNCSWFANYELGELYCYSYPNGSWSVAQNNPILFHKFDLPSLDNYEPVTLTGTDVKETITLQDHWIMQSGLYHNGKIFIQVEGDSTWDLTINGQIFDKSLGLHWLFVINAESGYIESYIPLYSAIEQEGMCIYDGELYMSEKYTTAPVGSICFRVVKYKF